MGILAGNIAVITGSDSGIGQAAAIEFARAGADVAITFLEDADGAESTKKQVEAASARAIVLHIDVGNEADVGRLFAACTRELGVPTILVNNAGVDAGGIKVADMSLDHWTAALRTNLTGAFLCCRQLIRGLRELKMPGKIVNISSIHQEIPRSGAAEYDASKGGLRNLTTTLALELAPLKINVNTIAPGMVLTPMNQKAIDDPKYLEEQVQSIPWKRAAEPWEIARLALYLVSSDADYVTGATFVIDGGLTVNTGQGA
jgi:glucose 1-dehydrogenase